MAYAAVIIFDDVDVRRTSGIRDMDGVVHLFRRKSEATTDDVEHFKSLDGGRSFSSDSIVLNTPSQFFDALIDDEDRLFLGVQKTTALDKPQLWQYDRIGGIWSKLTDFFDDVGNEKPVFRVDTSRRPGSQWGINRIFMVSTLDQAGQWNAVYADLEHVGTAYRVNVQTDSQFEPQTDASAAGNIFIAWRNGTDLKVYGCQKLETSPPTFSPAVVISKAGHACSVLTDMRINPLTELPAVLYLRTNGAIEELWIAELFVDGVTWIHQQVWDGVNNVKHYSGLQRLLYDKRGSVYAMSISDIPGGAVHGNPIIFQQVRALGVTVWSVAVVITSHASGSVPSLGPEIISLHGIDINTVRPSTLAQGVLCYVWTWDPGSAAFDLFYINLDEWPGSSVYPTAWVSVDGLPMYRAKIEELDEATATSYPLSGEGTSAGDFPDVPLRLVRFEEMAETARVNYPLGYVESRPKFSDIRGRFGYVAGPLDAADLATVQAFLAARFADLRPFDIPDGDTDGTKRTVFLAQSDNGGDELDIAEHLVDVGTYEIPFSVVETV